MMNNNTSEIFKRMNLQDIRHFFIYGADEYVPDTRSYVERIKTGSDPIYERLESVYPKGTELDAANNDLSAALDAYEEVYMELGMKAGARLVCQLLFENDLNTGEREDNPNE